MPEIIEFEGGERVSPLLVAPIKDPEKIVISSGEYECPPIVKSTEIRFNDPAGCKPVDQP